MGFVVIKVRSTAIGFRVAVCRVAGVFRAFGWGARARVTDDAGLQERNRERERERERESESVLELRAFVGWGMLGVEHLLFSSDLL